MRRDARAGGHRWIGLSPGVRVRRACVAAAALAIIGLVTVPTAGGSDRLATAHKAPYWLLRGPGVTSFGAFAGYIWNGNVRSVAATFNVPRVKARSHYGIAGTWIGAQGSGGTAAPFIQVGFNEERRRSGGSMYYAFYSDTVAAYHPRFLFFVRAGDILAARLRLSHGRWHVLILDRTHPHKFAFSTRDEADGVFNQAEWLQEDVSGGSGGVLPYPLLATRVRFRRLAVNSGRPDYARVRSEWMSENGTDLAPSPIVGDAFELSQRQPSRIGMHYLQIAVTLDIALASFESDFTRWTARTAARTITSQRAAIAATYELNIKELAATRWPARARRLADALVAATKRELARTERAPTPTSGGIERWIAEWLRAGSAASTIAVKIRRALDLPQLFSIPGSST